MVQSGGVHEGSQSSNFGPESCDWFVKNANLGALPQILNSEDVT